MLFVRFIFVNILFEFTTGEKYVCKDLIDAHKMTKSYFCDNFLISSFTAQLMNRRKINKYLKHKLEQFTEAEDDMAAKEKEKNPISVDSEEFKCPQHIVYNSCNEAIKNGEGVYLILPSEIDRIPFMASCMEDRSGGHAWTVIQKRVNDWVEFDETWVRYVRGFGDVTHSFWLGLETIHALTYERPHELLIELQDQNGDKRYAKYSHFAIGGPKTNYALILLGKYEGDLGDALRAHEGSQFSTKDKFNEGDMKCMELKKGGWWYSGDKPLCGQCHLNAAIQNNYWRRWMKEDHTFLETKIAIRKI